MNNPGWFFNFLEDSTLEDGALADIAISLGLVTRKQSQDALAETQPGVSLAQVLLKKGLIDPAGLEKINKEAERRKAGPPSIERFEIGPRIGEGAMAVVYRALDKQLNRPVALKILRATLDSQEMLKKRFLQEARAAAGVTHPQVVTIHDVGIAGDRMYLVMELVEGPALDEMVRDQKPTVPQAVQIVEKIARGVAAAHVKGVVHRDLKPGNVLMAGPEDPKVGDFGLALIQGNDQRLTRTGAVVGTPLYMSPEQVSGATKDVSSRTDVYALGVILYELLVGRPPHAGDSITQIYQAILWKDPVAPRDLNSAVSHDLQAVTLKALEKDPQRRYANAGELADDLKRVIEGHSVAARPQSMFRRWRRRNPKIAIAALIAGGVLLGVALWDIAGRVRVASLIRSAERAAREGRQAEARDLYSRAGADSEAQAAERRRQAEVLFAVGEAARVEVDRLVADLGILEDRKKSLEVETDPLAVDKSELWRARGDIERLRERIAERRAAMVAAYTRAFGADSTLGPPRKRLADYYWKEFLKAETTEHRQFVEMYALEKYPFDAPGKIVLESHPPGAKLAAYRFVDRPGGRLELEPAEFEGRPGSYLVELKKAGYRDVRYPVVVRRGETHRATVNLYTEDQIGADFVYVPGGKFIADGDPESLPPAPLVRESETGDFFIARFEVTAGEYLEFINSVLQELGHGEAQGRVPRESGSRVYWPIPEKAKKVRLHESWDLKCPVLSISWDDAVLYCEWKTTQAKRAGERVSYRLPRVAEWEKAARGVDGRVHPWGRGFDWTFMKGRLSQKERPLPGPVGAFPTDVSVYGVRDMAGSAAEWCEDPWDLTSGMRMAQGGSFARSDPASFRCASRSGLTSVYTAPDQGFRIVRVLDAR